VDFLYNTKYFKTILFDTQLDETTTLQQTMTSTVTMNLMKFTQYTSASAPVTNRIINFNSTGMLMYNDESERSLSQRMFVCFDFSDEEII
jgi:hypothetical protein